jgi:hypothetical protein
MSLKQSAAILAENAGGIDQYANELPGHHISSIAVPTEICGVKGRARLYFDPQSRASQRAELSERIERLKGELSALKRYPKSKLKRFSPYFLVLLLVKYQPG